MHKILYIVFSLIGAFTVILGAFGAHILKARIDEHHLMIFEKAVFYQFVHALAGLLCLTFASVYAKKGFVIPALLFLVGILFFSGSLYLLAVNEFLLLPTVIIGPVTPVGGLFFVGGWLAVFYNFVHTKIDFHY